MTFSLSAEPVSGRRKTIPALTGVIVFLLMSLPAVAQLNLGRVFGGITDQSGGAIVGAKVTVIDVQRGIARPLTTDNAGEYSAPSLIPGTYTVRAEATGFKTVERTDIVVGVGQDVRVDLSLQPGEQTQTITVTGEAPQIDTTNAQLGGELQNATLAELPVNGRQFTHMLEFFPGVVATPGGVNGTGVNANGVRGEQQVYMLDGLADMDNYVGGRPNIGGSGGPGAPDESTILPVDSIQEMTVVDNPKAEYGWKPGAVVNIGLKSGTNALHGTAYAFGSDGALDARNPFLTSTFPKTPIMLEQFGASIGGPIKKDKLFFFGNYEGQRELIGVSRIATVPTTAAGAGAGNSFPDAIYNIFHNAANTAHLLPNQLSLNLAGCNQTIAQMQAATSSSQITCNAANGVFGNAGASANEPLTINTSGGSDNQLTKIDYHINDHNALNGEYFFGNGNFLAAESATEPYWVTGFHQRSQVARAVWIWTPNSTWVNEARFGYDNTTWPYFTAECAQNLGQPNYTTTFGFVSGAPACGFPTVTVSGFASLGAQAQYVVNNSGTTAIADSVSYTHGKHLFKFGAELRPSHWTGATFTNAKGTISFGTGGVNAFTAVGGSGTTATALQDFLIGLPSSGVLLVGDPLRHLTEYLLAGFVQDDWRLTPKVTVNLGLRYEYKPPFTERNDMLANFNPSAATGLVQESGSNKYLWNPDYTEFEPRLGVAWDVTGKGTTVVRAGAGVVDTTLLFINTISTPQGAQLNAVPTGFTYYQVNGTKVAGTGTINTGTINLNNTQLAWQTGAPVFGSGSTGSLACGNGLGQNNPNGGTGATNPANPAPCNISIMNPNWKPGYVTTWTLSVEHAITNNLALNVAYVGTHGGDLDVITDINQPALGSANGKSAPTSEAEQIRRPYYSQFPYFGKILEYNDYAWSNYNALQVSIKERASHGLTLNAGYTYSHTLDFSNDDTNSNNVMNSLDPALEYADSKADPRHRGYLTLTYLVPGRKSFGQMLEGWQINSTVTLLGAYAWNAADTTSDISGTGESLDRWTLVGSPSNFDGFGQAGRIPCYGLTTSTVFSAANGCTVGTSLPAACTAAAAAEATGPGGTTGTQSLNTLGCYMVGDSVIVPPAQGTFGTMGRNVLRTPWFHQWDFSVSKNVRLGERLSAQFRAEFFNVLNSVAYAPPSSNPDVPATFGQSQSTANSSNPIIGNGGPRQIQLGLKFLF